MSKQLTITLSLDSILPAYCAVTYRNKIIVHQDCHRLYWYKRRVDGKLQLEPMRQSIHISKEDAETLQRLRETFKSIIPGLSGENNQFMQLHLLFYNIPISKIPIRQEADRITINGIAERGGCPSMTIDELLAAVDQFTIAILSR